MNARSKLSIASAALLLLSSKIASAVQYSNDSLRTGWYPSQPSLAPYLVSIGSFGQLFSTPVNGQVYAQPLVSNGILFVATDRISFMVSTRQAAPRFGAASLGCPGAV
jgi:hypothetical protein